MTNGERLNQLQALVRTLDAGDFAQACKLHYEWVKTGVFTLKESQDFGRMIQHASYQDGWDDGDQSHGTT